MTADSRIRDIVRDLTGADVPASGEVRFADIPGWDSVAHLHLLLDVEQTFGIQIPDDFGMSVDSIRRLAAWVEGRTASGNTG